MDYTVNKTEQLFIKADWSSNIHHHHHRNHPNKLIEFSKVDRVNHLPWHVLYLVYKHIIDYSDNNNIKQQWRRCSDVLKASLSKPVAVYPEFAETLLYENEGKQSILNEI